MIILGAWMTAAFWQKAVDFDNVNSDETPESEFPSSKAHKFPELQVPKFPSSRNFKFPELQVPKFPELQVPGISKNIICSNYIIKQNWTVE